MFIFYTTMTDGKSGFGLKPEIILLGIDASLTEQLMNPSELSTILISLITSIDVSWSLFLLFVFNPLQAAVEQKQKTLQYTNQSLDATLSSCQMECGIDFRMHRVRAQFRTDEFSLTKRRRLLHLSPCLLHPKPASDMTICRRRQT